MHQPTRPQGVYGAGSCSGGDGHPCHDHGVSAGVRWVGPASVKDLIGKELGEPCSGLVWSGKMKGALDGRCLTRGLWTTPARAANVIPRQRT